MIITVCYGTQKTWESREEAMSFFLEAMQLGLNYCTDKDFA